MFTRGLDVMYAHGTGCEIWTVDIFTARPAICSESKVLYSLSHVELWLC